MADQQMFGQGPAMSPVTYLLSLPIGEAVEEPELLATYVLDGVLNRLEVYLQRTVAR